MTLFWHNEERFEYEHGGDANPATMNVVARCVAADLPLIFAVKAPYGYANNNTIAFDHVVYACYVKNCPDLDWLPKSYCQTITRR